MGYLVCSLAGRRGSGLQFRPRKRTGNGEGGLVLVQHWPASYHQIWLVHVYHSVLMWWKTCIFIEKLTFSTKKMRVYFFCCILVYIFVVVGWGRGGRLVFVCL